MNSSVVRTLFQTASITMAFAFSAPAFAVPINLGEASDFNVFAFGDYAGANSDTWGGIAVEGDASFKSFGINSHNIDDPGLVVGGNFSLQNGQVYGNAEIGGTTTLNSAGITGNQSSSVSVDFGTTKTHLDALSTQLSGLSATGTQNNAYGTMTFSGSGQNGSSDVQVFNLSNQEFVDGKGFQLNNVDSNDTIILNVAGSHINFGAAWTYSGLQSYAENILFNLYEATSVNLSKEIWGSILAQNADTSCVNDGNVNGQVIIGNWNCSSQSIEVHGYYFNNPETYSTPVAAAEPGALGLITLGAAGLVLVRRRQKRD